MLARSFSFASMMSGSIFWIISSAARVPPAPWAYDDIIVGPAYADEGEECQLPLYGRRKDIPTDVPRTSYTVYMTV